MGGRVASRMAEHGVEVTRDLTGVETMFLVPVRERAEEKLYTRLGELRQLAATHGHDPVVAVAGCVAQQEGDALLRRGPGVADVVVGTQAIRRLPMLVHDAATKRLPSAAASACRYSFARRWSPL